MSAQSSRAGRLMRRSRAAGEAPARRRARLVRSSPRRGHARRCPSAQAAGSVDDLDSTASAYSGRSPSPHRGASRPRRPASPAPRGTRSDRRPPSGAGSPSHAAPRQAAALARRARSATCAASAAVPAPDRRPRRSAGDAGSRPARRGRSAPAASSAPSRLGVDEHRGAVGVDHHALKARATTSWARRRSANARQYRLRGRLGVLRAGRFGAQAPCQARAAQQPSGEHRCGDDLPAPDEVEPSSEAR